MHDHNAKVCYKVRNKLDILLKVLQGYEEGKAARFDPSEYDEAQTVLSDCKDILSEMML